MKGFIKRVARRVLGRASIVASVTFPVPLLIKFCRRLSDIQLTDGELLAVIRIVKEKAPCRFLVFGVGNDSALWCAANRGGRTTFLEDDETWLREVKARLPDIEAYRVSYGTTLSQWKELVSQPEALALTLPAELADSCWDVVFVDAPAGWNDSSPGRMKSIYFASRLAARGAEVFIHDCDRMVERECCDRFLGVKSLRKEVGKLRHYATNVAATNRPAR